MTHRAAIIRDQRGAAAAEMALVLPLLLAIMFGAMEVGNYFLNEHILVKAVRDGARYAARQNFSNYSACTGNVADPVRADTRLVVRTGLLSGGTNRLVNWTDASIDVTMTCTTTAGGQTMSGIYKGRAAGVPIVTVKAIVPYTPVLASFGFKATSLKLNASQQAAVTGI